MARQFLQFDAQGTLAGNQSDANAFITALNTTLGYSAGNPNKTTTYGSNFTYTGIIVRVEILDSVYPLLTAPQQAKVFEDFKNLVTITSPLANQVYQRNGSNQADVVIKGTYAGTRSGAIEASFNGGSFVQVSSGLTGGTFTLTLPAQAQGAGTFTIRQVADTNNSKTVSNVGIGDVFIKFGQSNMGEQATNQKSYTPTTIKCGAWNKSAGPSTWADLNTAGDFCPGFATSFLSSQSLPCAFIYAAIGGTSIAEWLPDSTSLYTDTSGFNPFGQGLNLYNRMIAMIAATNCGGVKAALWHQGEADSAAGTSTATYQADLQTIANQVFADLGVKTFPAKLQTMKDTNNVTIPNTNVNTAVGNLWSTGAHIGTGADFSDQAADTDGFGQVHLKSDAHIAVMATRWWTAMKNEFGYA
jgi:hypothetical protein